MNGRRTINFPSSSLTSAAISRIVNGRAAFLPFALSPWRTRTCVDSPGHCENYGKQVSGISNEIYVHMRTSNRIDAFRPIDADAENASVPPSTMLSKLLSNTPSSSPKIMGPALILPTRCVPLYGVCSMCSRWKEVGGRKGKGGATFGSETGVVGVAKVP